MLELNQTVLIYFSDGLRDTTAFKHVPVGVFGIV
jgi:hypothetical protein